MDTPTHAERKLLLAICPNALFLLSQSLDGEADVPEPSCVNIDIASAIFNTLVLEVTATVNATIIVCRVGSLPIWPVANSVCAFAYQTDLVQK